MEEGRSVLVVARPAEKSFSETRPWSFTFRRFISKKENFVAASVVKALPPIVISNVIQVNLL
jgi:hypothetical protein